MLGRQLKIWSHLHVKDNHALKILKLWLGYEFIDLMDIEGKFYKYSFNEIRRRLGYKTNSLLFQDIKRTKSFYLIGESDNNITAIFSPIWHKYNKSDGNLLVGSITIKESLNESPVATVYKEYINKDNPNGVTADAVSFLEGDDNRDVYVRRNIVRKYFEWFNKQTDLDHKSLREDLSFHIQNPLDKNGKIIEKDRLTDKETSEGYQMLIDIFLIPYFTNREDFFKDAYISHPEKRIYWLKNFFVKSKKGYGAKIRNKIYKKRKENKEEEFNAAWKRKVNNTK